MKLIRNAGYVGGLGLVVAIIWSYLHAYIEQKDDPPGWIIDRDLYLPPYWLGLAGLLILIISLIVGMTKRLARRRD